MRARGLALALALCLAGSAALAVDINGTVQTDPAVIVSMQQLLQEGFEIKTAVPNGNKVIIFMQKEQAAYACEFVSLTKSRCGALN